jgi:hypothetical protein
MITPIPENVSSWLGSLVTIMGDILPPRDPNHDEDEDEEEDEEDQGRNDEPAVVREPDPDE